MTSLAHISWKDFDDEVAGTNLNMPTLTSANFDSVTAGVTAVRQAMVDLTRGRVTAETVSWKNQVSGSAVVDQEAQRETKFLVTYLDGTEWMDAGETVRNPGYNKKFTVEIPTANLTFLDPTGSGLVDLAGTEAAAFVTAFETHCGSPYNADSPNRTITVLSIRHVGRSS